MQMNLIHKPRFARLLASICRSCCCLVQLLRRKQRWRAYLIGIIAVLLFSFAVLLLCSSLPILTIHQPPSPHTRHHHITFHSFHTQFHPEQDASHLWHSILNQKKKSLVFLLFPRWVFFGFLVGFLLVFFGCSPLCSLDVVLLRF